MDEAPLADALLEPLSAGVDALLALLEDEVGAHGGTDVQTTRVREKAAKALARLCAFLPSDLFASVLDATLATLHDDPAPATAHGALFTLGCFATRHILSAAQADAVVAAMPPFLLYRLHQAAAPTAVRDTACFVLWAAAHYGAASPALTAPSTLQALVLLALTDRAVNTRRAAGAVLQEIVGRRGAERVPQGLALLGLLNYAALGNAQWAFAALVPRVAALEAYGSCVLERMRWIAENQDDFGVVELAGKAVFFSAQRAATTVLTCVLQPILQANWAELPWRVFRGYLTLLAQGVGGFARAGVSLPREMVRECLRLLTVPPKRFHSRGRESSDLRNARLLLLKNLVLFCELTHDSGVSLNEIHSALTTFFPCPSPTSVGRLVGGCVGGCVGGSVGGSVGGCLAGSWPQRQLRFTVEEGCLQVLSRFLAQQAFAAGIQHCRQLADAAVASGTEYAVHLFGAIWWEVSLPLLPRLLQRLPHAPPEVAEAITTVAGRLLRVGVGAPDWGELLVRWVNGGCACYARDIRGDVGSWARVATLGRLQEVLLARVWAAPQGTLPARLDDPEIATAFGTAMAVPGCESEYQPLSFLPPGRGACLFPDATALVESLPQTRASSPREVEAAVSEAVVPAVLKQLCEQHAAVREAAFACLTTLLRHAAPAAVLTRSLSALLPTEFSHAGVIHAVIAALATERSPVQSLSQSLQQPAKQSPSSQESSQESSQQSSQLSSQLSNDTPQSDLTPTLLRGLVYTVGGNTPTVTEQAVREFAARCAEEEVARRVATELVAILGEELERKQNGFYPALKTLLVCGESCDLPSVLEPTAMADLKGVMERAFQRFSGKVVVVRSLFELHQQLFSSYVSETDLIRASLPYLSCAFPSVSIGLSIEI